MSAGLMLACQAVAFWPVWLWYSRRITDGSDENVAIVALITAVVFWARSRSPIMVSPSTSLRTSMSKDEQPTALVPAAAIGLTLAYALTYPFALPIVRMGLAVLALAATASALHSRRSLPPAWFGLVLLSLPVLASMQFVLGYPLRVMVGIVTAGILQLAGLDVVRDGITLRAGDLVVLIDAPCSGVRMLCTGLYLALTLACWFELRWLRTAAVILTSIVAVLAANITRATMLFLREAMVPDLGDWSHTAIGVATFLFAVIAIGFVARRLAETAKPSWRAVEAGAHA